MAQGKVGDIVIATGYAFKDAELKHIGDKGTSLCEFTVVVGKEADGKGKFANCKAWRELGEYAANIKKGDAVCVMGTLESREYNGKTYNNLVADWLNIAGAGTSATPSKEFPAGVKFIEEFEDGNSSEFSF